MRLLLGSPAQVDCSNGLLGRPVGEHLVATVLRLYEAQYAVSEVELDIGDPEQVLAEDTDDTVTKIVVADEKLLVTDADACHRERLGGGNLGNERAANTGHVVPRRRVDERQFEFRRRGG